MSLNKALTTFYKTKKFQNKGPLSVALVITQHAKKMGLPLDPNSLITDGGGQVLGLGKGAVQAVLKRHGIDRVLAKEGGRTSRGSLNKMRDYTAFLNQLHQEAAPVDLDTIEAFWVERVREFFAGKPFKIKLDSSRSLRSVVRDVISQAIARQKDANGTYYAGAVMQHLVGAKLDCFLGIGCFDHNGFSTSDEQSGRAGDFLIEDVAIHVTTSPGEAVIARCKDNLDEGLRPILVTLQKGVQVAEGLAENASLHDRIDIFEMEQFIALNLYELGRFKSDHQKIAVTDVVNRYNAIVSEWETDPSLQIEFATGRQKT
ncbi:DUF4928 family protein [Magnetococcus sp. PR-3]|uniref:DUF4928 family protein n=1 Tax=Magnetococcus sp. PR-3 TaxID=3120355 RepID=UPI002FCE3B53